MLGGSGLGSFASLLFFSFYIAGSANEAAALGMILIVMATLSVLVINRLAGARLGGMFG